MEHSFLIRPELSGVDLSLWGADSASAKRKYMPWAQFSFSRTIVIYEESKGVFAAIS